MSTKCPVCGKEYELSLNNSIQEISIKCQKCESSFSVNSDLNEIDRPCSIKIHGYKEWFLINSKISIYKGDEFIGKISRKETIPIIIDKDCTFKFKNGTRTSIVEIRKNSDTDILLAIDRFSGKLKTIVANKDNFSQLSQTRDQNSRISTIATIALIVLFLIASILMIEYLPRLRHY